MAFRVTRQKLLWPLLVAATIFFASMHSRVAMPGVNNFDKVAHFSVYGLLATLLGRLGRGRRAWWMALLATSLFGASDEWHQYYVPGRSCDFYDWLADTLGGALALTLYAAWPWYRAQLEAALGGKRRRENQPQPAPVISR
jgi:VanZ family protein